ncbi:MAG: DUF1599 domain-containing protein [Cytophagales bacterium]|nr:DUF1599 domain-containing protein [Cytophagales bacterium]
MSLLAGKDTASLHKVHMDRCRRVFEKKMDSYGSAWCLLRPASLLDMLLMKIRRIRSVQDQGESWVEEDEMEGFTAIVNYAMMSLIYDRLSLGDTSSSLAQRANLPYKKIIPHWNKEEATISELLRIKNHDYGEYWKDLQITSIVDIILMRIYRIRKMMETQKDLTDLPSMYRDIVNYAIFSLIKLDSIDS